MKLKFLAPVFGILLSLAGISSAFAAGKDDHALVVHLTGASPTLMVGAPTSPGSIASYDYTNRGNGTAAGVLPVLWQYDEKGSIITPSSSVINSAVYDIEPAARPSIKVALHVITTTYRIHYDNPAMAPCSTGSFSYQFVEGARANGTFAPMVTPTGCMPTYSMDVTIQANSDAERSLRKGI
ncbi:MAG TPA: hypothetical protein VFS62_01155 [Chloroflexota bacterium]|jgi:hypothetical protein|nr:hypothetical protein [Chloroflexota bacterium]